MLVLGCGIRRDTSRAYQLHDVDQLAIARPVTKGVFRPANGAELYTMIREACALARSGTPGPVMIEVSVELYLHRQEVNPDSWGPAAIPPVPAATNDQIKRAIALLTAPGARPLLYAGLGAQACQAEPCRIAEARRLSGSWMIRLGSSANR